MSFTPPFDYLKPPSPDQTTLSQYYEPRSTKIVGVDPPASNHDNDRDPEPIPPAIPTAIPPTKPPPPNSPKSTTIKKKVNYHKKKNRIHVGAHVYSRLGELQYVHPGQKRRVRQKNMGLSSRVLVPMNGKSTLKTILHSH